MRSFTNSKKHISFYNLRERERAGGGERRDYNDFSFSKKLFETIFKSLIHLRLNHFVLISAFINANRVYKYILIPESFSNDDT